MSRSRAGLAVCTNLNSESSPQLRFLVGDYATFDRSRCEVRSAVEVLAPGTLPRTEFKAARVKDRRGKSGN